MQRSCNKSTHAKNLHLRVTNIKKTQRHSNHFRRLPLHGFTLVELMVVIVIIGLLASVVGVNVIGYIAKAKRKTAQVQIKIFHNAVKLYKLDTGQYPENSMGLEALVEQPPGVIGWNTDGYLDGASQIPLDPWRYPYEYQYPGEYSTYDIFSLGADGNDGGDDEDADIYNSDVLSAESAEDQNF